MVDPDRLSAAYETARCDLLAESAAAGHWTGQLSSSALSTATAISALAIVERHAPTVAGRLTDETRQCRLSELIIVSLRWLAKRQNPDGGWGDTDKSPSNIATTMLVRAAFALTCVPADHPGLLERADAYIRAAGGVRALARRYGKDKRLSVAILTNCALAGLVPWRKVPALGFERVCGPTRFWTRWRLPVVSHVTPALVALGQASYFQRKPLNPLTRLMRRAAIHRSLDVVDAMQPASGGFLESAPLTSFVVMSLASIGRADHPVVRKGVEFLLNSVGPDGSWPIGANLAIWNTALATSALAAAGEDVCEIGCLDWLLVRQQRESNPYSLGPPGGWAWTDLPGGVPDTDSTSAALLALAAGRDTGHVEPARIQAAAACGVQWLAAAQNADGGWPTFRGARAELAFAHSGCDLTAHALRALHAWRGALMKSTDNSATSSRELDQRIGAAIDRGLRFLKTHQHPDGCWQPSRFGSHDQPAEDNPIYGTAKVLFALRDLGQLDCEAATRGLAWLVSVKHADGNWGTEPFVSPKTAFREPCIEETALATEALVTCGQSSAHEAAAHEGLKWLIDAVEANRHQHSSPIGYCYGKVAYYEKLYPLIMTVAALGRAARRLLLQPAPRTVAHSGKT